MVIVPVRAKYEEGRKRKEKKRKKEINVLPIYIGWLWVVALIACSATRPVVVAAAESEDRKDDEDDKDEMMAMMKS